MTESAIIRVPAFGPLSRNTPSPVFTFTDPLPAGARLLRVEVAVTTRPLFYDLFGKGVVAGDRILLGGVLPLDARDQIGNLSTFGPACGQPQAEVAHTVVHDGAPPRYAYGDTNALQILNDFNPVDMGALRLVLHYRIAVDAEA